MALRVGPSLVVSHGIIIEVILIVLFVVRLDLHDLAVVVLNSNGLSLWRQFFLNFL